MEVTWEEKGKEEEEAEAGGVGVLWRFLPNIRLRSLVQLEPFCPFFIVATEEEKRKTI